MILSDSEILRQMDQGNIEIEPFDRKNLGGNSYDVHLAGTLVVYLSDQLDSRMANPTFSFNIPENGFVLQPGELYLASTIERTKTDRHVPVIDGKSSLGRLGIAAHITAGRGDVGFNGFWTLEVFCLKPVRIYEGMKFAQITFHSVEGEVLSRYDTKPDAKYSNQPAKPVESQMWQNFTT